MFAEKDVLYGGQPVGVVVAQSQDLADFAAARVVLRYSDVRKPLLYVTDVLRQGNKERIKLVGSIEPTERKGK